jgi:hypothetical protein
MSRASGSRKRSLAVAGSWLPVPLDFLRSKACAELSPLGAKLLLDGLSMLGPNATRNGDISLAPKIMRLRGWSGRSSLAAAISELIEHGLLVKTRQGSRLDCSLFALTLYPLDADVLHKLDVRPGCYLTRDFAGENGALAQKPTEANPAKWRRARKLKSVAPPRDKVVEKRPATGQTQQPECAKEATLSRHGTKPPVFQHSTVPPRVTYLDSPFGSTDLPCSQLSQKDRTRLRAALSSPFAIKLARLRDRQIPILTH